MIESIIPLHDANLELKPTPGKSTFAAHNTDATPKESGYSTWDTVPLILTIEDLMEILHIGRNTAYSLVRTRQIRSIRIGNKIRVERSSLEAFLKEK